MHDVNELNAKKNGGRGINFEVIASVLLKFQIFKDVTSFILVNSYGHFEGRNVMPSSSVPNIPVRLDRLNPPNHI